MNEKDSLPKTLAGVDVFNKISEADRNRLAEIATSHYLEKGETLVFQGDHWPEVIYVRSGKLRWSLLAESGKEHTFFRLGTGSVFWGHTIFDDQPMPASLIAISPSVVYSWKKEQIKPVLVRHPEAMWEIGRTLVGMMRRNREVVINLAFRQVTGRLAKFLLDLSADGSMEIERDITLDEISTMLAASPQVICRALYELEREDILKVNRAQITINQRDRLKELVGNA